MLISSSALRKVITTLPALAIVLLAAQSIYAGPKPGFTAFIAGNAADAQPAPTLSPGLVLMGGGTDVDAAFQFMCQRAGGGDFVVIRPPVPMLTILISNNSVPRWTLSKRSSSQPSRNKLGLCPVAICKMPGAVDSRGDWSVDVCELVARNGCADRSEFSAELEARDCWWNECGSPCSVNSSLRARSVRLLRVGAGKSVSSFT